MSAVEGVITVEDIVTRYGLRRVHLMSHGKRVDPRVVSPMVPWEGEGSLAFFEQEEKELRTWHLTATWRAHEPTTLKMGGEELTGVLWYLEKGTRLSEEVEAAAFRYVAYYDNMPNLAFVHKMQKGWKSAVEFKAGEMIRIALKELSEIPENCIFVMEEKCQEK